MDKSMEKYKVAIEALDAIFKDMVEAIHLKPDGHNLEELRIYVDNTYSTLNRTALRVKEIKTLLEKELKLNLETWNPPA
ncbi:MAG: hypothetical protein LC102_02870 [Ignavibacteriales bacterium]|nr:MAG: hypothetical protein F9K26_06380 [Ignavibacteriaceae bacterium]MBW7873015.1 hypothetical protein [Ignavibacteria bacterium]MCZ2142356.1 hypothetical protein [Ignavibacteriales bacterium]OQY75878.1 MAG: hypothetical protein B6D45_05005 [Ignavibacteriales bacterium UTCHB3]MBV6445239.1 hypothetical protein [Ignavibacteriaceae bacterium]